MQYPTAGAITQPAFAHAVKKELQKPGCARQCRKQIVCLQWRLLIRIVAKSTITGIEYHTPDEIGG